jgi:hypothetical protein
VETQTDGTRNLKVGLNYTAADRRIGMGSVEVITTSLPKINERITINGKLGC